MKWLPALKKQVWEKSRLFFISWFIAHEKVTQAPSPSPRAAQLPAHNQMAMVLIGKHNTLLFSLFGLTDRTRILLRDAGDEQEGSWATSGKITSLLRDPFPLQQSHA